MVIPCRKRFDPYEQFPYLLPRRQDVDGFDRWILKAGSSSQRELHECRQTLTPANSLLRAHLRECCLQVKAGEQCHVGG
jgi:hypothetical protein